MSRVTHTQITITKNPMLKVPLEVPQWEAHILLALWGEDAQVTGTVVYERDIPETNDEFTRLANKYGPRDEDIPFVARVYGSFGPGLRGLEQEFRASIANSPVASVADPENAEPVELDRTLLAGFDGSAAPAAPTDEGFKILDVAPETLEAIPAGVVITADDVKVIDGVVEKEVIVDNTDTFAGMTIEGIDAGTFLKSDVSDLTGEGSDDA